MKLFSVIAVRVRSISGACFKCVPSTRTWTVAMRAAPSITVLGEFTACYVLRSVGTYALPKKIHRPVVRACRTRCCSMFFDTHCVLRMVILFSTTEAMRTVSPHERAVSMTTHAQMKVLPTNGLTEAAASGQQVNIL